jgi:hypothetical protein
MGSNPEVARAVRSLYLRYREAHSGLQNLAARLSDGQTLTDGGLMNLPPEEVTDLLQSNQNHFPELDEAAEGLWHEEGLHRENIWGGLKRYLATKHEVQVHIARADEMPDTLRRYDRDRRELLLSELLPSRSRKFHLARQIALLEHQDLLATLTDVPTLSTEASRDLGRVVLANYFAAAVLMPYEKFFKNVKQQRYDIEVLCDRFNASFEQVCHRLTTLRRPGSEGIPLHMLRVDIAGNISKRFSASGHHLPRFGTGCPRWSIYKAFHTPQQIRLQVSEDLEGRRFFCISRTVRKTMRGYLLAAPANHAVGIGCDVSYASEMVYADRLNLQNEAEIVPIGTTCRLCSRTDCTERAVPSIQQPLHLDENVTRLSAYSSRTPES